MLRSGFAAHAVADEFNVGLRNLALKTDVRVHPVQVIEVEDIERLESYLLSRDFRLKDCLRARIYEDPRHRWGFWDFMKLRYLPSRGISPRSNTRLDATFEWLVEATLWRLYRGDYLDFSLGTIESTGRAYICVRPQGGDGLFSDEEKVFSEHSSVEEAYRALDELSTSGLPDFKILADSFEFRVVDQFGTELDRP